MTARPHDALFKAAFERTDHAGSLLRSILPPAIRDAIDWTTLTHEPGSFIDRQLADGHSDLLFSAKLAVTRTDVDTAYLYLLFEHRSTPEPYLPRRMLALLDGIWERHCTQHGGPLPIVLPILVCHAAGGWTAATAMQDLFAPHPDAIPGLAKHVPHFCVLVEDLAHLTNDQIKQRALATFPTLALWLLRDARDADTLLINLAYWVDTFREALRAPDGMQAVAQLLSYIYWVCADLHFQQFREKIREQLRETEETAMTIAEQLIQQGRAEGRMEGRVEGRMEGRVEGRAEGRMELLEQLVVERFGALPDPWRTRLSAATDEQLVRYARRLFEVETLEALFDD